DYTLNPGDGAFYGPKIDFHLKDAIGRTWQCGTIQFDMAQPENFDLSYEGKDGKKHRPIMLHRTVYGSLERFMGILVEHYSGKFPLWLNPNQVVILPVADRFQEYADKVAQSFREVGIRADVDGRTESISRKVRDAELQHYNYILVVGEKEIKDKTVTVRTRDNQVEGAVKSEEFAKRVVKEMKAKKL
ncbi:threonine--tRNA ligase, partial [Candidatus Woesearchaeota archaeon]|nr:threonine--tRNA ligase [Candidatus Woesearchaeota archaeon]